MIPSVSQALSSGLKHSSILRLNTRKAITQIDLSHCFCFSVQGAERTSRRVSVPAHVQPQHVPGEYVMHSKGALTLSASERESDVAQNGFLETQYALISYQVLKNIKENVSL